MSLFLRNGAEQFCTTKNSYQLTMQKMKQLRILSVLLLAGSFTACNKDSAETPKAPEPSVQELLISKNWKCTALTVNPGYDFNNDGIEETDVLGAYSPCKKDNIWNFESDGSFVVDEGPAKCNIGDVQTKTFLWSVKDDGKTLVMYGNDYPILQLDQNILKCKFEFTDAGTTYTQTITFQH